MPSKYRVTVWKTESYCTVVEVIAGNRHDAQELAVRAAIGGDELLHWEFTDSDIEADVPTHGVYTDENV